jgi:hypothetical protein
MALHPKRKKPRGRAKVKPESGPAVIPAQAGIQPGDA